MKRFAIHTGIVLAFGWGLALVLLWLLSNSSTGLPVARAADLHVCPSGCTYTTIQDAVDDADPGDVIKVAAGTYTGVQARAGVTQVVYISQTVTIRGGYTTTNWTTPDPAANPTTLDAQGQGRVIYVTGNISPTIEGLRLTGGDAAGLSGGSFGHDAGGGVYVITATVVISHNQVFNNTAYDGGGLYLGNGAATLSANVVTANTTAYAGGGLYLDNSAATLNANAVTANTATSYGGGLLLWLSDATLTNNVVADNRVNGLGSGLYIEVSSPRLLHTTIARNSGGDGSGIHLAGGGFRTVALTNTILFSHTVGITVAAGNTATVESTLWHGNTTDANGAGTIISSTHNYAGDPAFVNPEAGDYHLGSTSAAIDKGVDAGVTTDIDGDARPQGSAPDLGADERPGPSLPGLAITKVDKPDPVKPGGLLTYTLTVNNHGTAAATNLVITDTVPIDASFASASHGGTESNGIVTWNVISLTNGASLNRTLAVTASVPPTNGQVITNAIYGVRCAEVPAPTWGPAVTTTAKLVVAAALQKWPAARVITRPQYINYSYLVTNTGTVVISNATVSDDKLGFIGSTGQLAPGQPRVLIGEGLIATNITNVATATATSAYGSTSVGASATVTFEKSVACTPTIQSAASGDWGVADTWNLNRVPGRADVVLIQGGHTVTGPVSADVQRLCNYGFLQSKTNRPLFISATGGIFNYGYVLGSEGGVGTGGDCGGRGSNLQLRGSPVYNEGTIRAGNGGDGDRCGGEGGWTTVLGRDTTNVGTICAGKGGDVRGSAEGQGGDGGRAYIWGKWHGPGYLINVGLACGGDGGDGHSSATQPQTGGRGGSLSFVALSSVFLNDGQQYGGQGGKGTGGGFDGQDSWVFFEPNTISLAGRGTEVRGGNVVVFGGNGWVLDLSGMSRAAISATGHVTLAVGTGGVVDLRGNTSQVLKAGGQVMIASDVISLEAGIALSDVVGTNFVTGASQILYNVSLVGPGRASGRPGLALPLHLTILNGGPEPDTYTLSRSDLAGWSLGALPPSVTVEGLDLSDLTLNVTPPTTATLGALDVITVMATSQADPNVVAVVEVEVSVEAGIYLPLIRKD